VTKNDVLNSYPLELLTFRRLWIFSPVMQTAAIAFLYATTTLLFVRTFRLTGRMLGGAPDVWILFVPISEEILFRGIILGALELAYGRVWAVIGSSTLFFGPVTGILVLKIRSV
jgi:membrane protease YdiL (CAAX protease family)